MVRINFMDNKSLAAEIEQNCDILFEVASSRICVLNGFEIFLFDRRQSLPPEPEPTKGIEHKAKTKIK
jgi:hypothetical protein